MYRHLQTVAATTEYFDVSLFRLPVIYDQIQGQPVVPATAGTQSPFSANNHILD